MKFVLVAASLTVGNFVWQIHDHHWLLATERSYFQIMAVLTVWIVGRIVPEETWNSKT